MQIDMHKALDKTITVLNRCDGDAAGLWKATTLTNAQYLMVSDAESTSSNYTAGRNDDRKALIVVDSRYIFSDLWDANTVEEATVTSTWTLRPGDMIARAALTETLYAEDDETETGYTPISTALKDIDWFRISTIKDRLNEGIGTSSGVVAKYASCICCEGSRA